jgi:preprotein translocase subunit SecG
MNRLLSLNEPKLTNGTSTSLYTESKRDRSNTMTESDNEKVYIYKANTKQSIMSRLTICHIIIFVLISFCIIGVFIIVMIFKERNTPCKGILF